MKRYKSHRQRKGREPLWQKKLLSESVDKVQTMAAEMREDKVKQLFFTDCAVYKLCALCMKLFTIVRPQIIVKYNTIKLCMESVKEL